MDLSFPTLTTNTDIIPVFGDNVQDLLGTGTLNVNPTGIIVVNSIADTVDDPGSGVITLRDAINQANGDNGEDLIVFDRSVFSLAQTITLSGTELDLTHNLDIIAPRDPLTGDDLLTVSGNKASRVFEIESGATVRLDGLIVADGVVTDDNGGGIKNSGTLTINNSVVRNNYENLTFQRSSGGGAIYNTGTLTVNNSTISDNSIINQNYYGVLVSSYGSGILNGGSLTVNNSTISYNGSYSPDSKGGGIYNTGVLSLNNSTVSGNSVSGYSYINSRGGGIFNTTTGILTISNSTISGNSVSGIVPQNRGSDGGGIDNSGTLTISNSTLSDNKAESAGGGINNSGSLTVSNSTFSNNTVEGGGSTTTYSGPNFGGAISNGGSLTVNNSTLSGNTAYGYGSGIAGGGTIRNTIIAGNRNTYPYTSPDNKYYDVSGAFTSLGYNLIGGSPGNQGFGVTGDIVGTADNPIDPRLAPLDFNGGPTQTIALLPDSPAIDAGDPIVLDTDPITDQRGLPRVSNGRADIGAFEVQV